MAISRQPPESKFAYVLLAAKRARQLMINARPLVDNPRSHKPTRIAMEELNEGLLEFEVPEAPESAEEKEGKRRKP